MEGFQNLFVSFLIVFLTAQVESATYIKNQNILPTVLGTSPLNTALGSVSVVPEIISNVGTPQVVFSNGIANPVEVISNVASPQVVLSNGCANPLEVVTNVGSPQVVLSNGLNSPLISGVSPLIAGLTSPLISNLGSSLASISSPLIGNVLGGSLLTNIVNPGVINTNIATPNVLSPLIIQAPTPCSCGQDTIVSV